MRKVFLLFILCWIAIPSYSQVIADSVLIAKFKSYSRSHPEIILFTHTDKTLYTNNETIWFSSYLVENTLTDTVHKHSTLSAMLTREDNKKIMLQMQFLMDQGLSFGGLALTDSIPPGNYRLSTFTNILDTAGYPLAFFEQSLTIKSITQPSFQATLTLLDTIPVNGKLRAMVTAGTDKAGLGGFDINYTIGSFEAKPVTLRSNEVSHTIEIPAQYLTSTNPVLSCSIKHEKEIQYLSVKLPETPKTGIAVRLFPEGGSLTDDVESVIALESLTSNGLPVNITGILFQDNLPIDTVTSNSYGIGSFKLRPKTGAKYTFRVKANSFLTSDTSYQLPAIIKNGVVLHLDKAIVNDTLRMQLFSKDTQLVQVIIHTNQKVYASFTARPALKGSLATVALPGVPKGLATITVLDGAGRPVAERLFFAHYDQKINAEIKTNKETFGKKEKVTLSIKLTDKNSLPLQGLVSVAVVQENRLEGGKFKDIETETYLAYAIGSIPRDPSGIGTGDPAFLENVLLVRGWRNYTWQNLMEDAGDSIRLVTPQITGRVMASGKPYKEISSVSIMRDSLIDHYTTLPDGTWILPEEKLLVTQGTLLLASIQKQPRPLYVTIDNPMVKTGQLLSNDLTMQPAEIAFNRAETSNNIIRNIADGITLQEVRVTAKPHKTVIYKGAPGANACGDYICEYGVLNCPVHFGATSTQPIKGQTYAWATGLEKSGGVSGVTVYEGCRYEGNPEGIYLAKEFYGVDISQEGKLMPQFLSTLAWKPGLLADNNGIVSFDFYTGDISDTFSIVVQGVGKQDVVSGSSKFLVK